MTLLRRRFDRGSGIAILNALTNCLAIGDVTVVRRSIEIVEVKSSKTKSSRKVRQKQAMKEVVTLLGTGSGENEGGESQLRPFLSRQKPFSTELRNSFEQQEQGWAARRISDWQYYVEAYDFRKFTSEDNVKKLTKEIREAAIGNGKNEAIIPTA